MAQRQKSRFWRLCRIYFRRFRILIWSIVLLVLAALIYVNQVGLPGFIKKALIGKIARSGDRFTIFTAALALVPGDRR